MVKGAAQAMKSSASLSLLDDEGEFRKRRENADIIDKALHSKINSMG